MNAVGPTSTTTCAYDGACFVYGRNQALRYLENEAEEAVLAENERIPPSNDNAAVVTCTTNGENIHFFGYFASKSKKRGTQYHQCHISSGNLVDSYEGFKRGRRMIRNAQEYAKNEAQNLRDQLVSPWKD